LAIAQANRTLATSLYRMIIYPIIDIPTQIDKYLLFHWDFRHQSLVSPLLFSFSFLALFYSIQKDFQDYLLLYCLEDILRQTVIFDDGPTKNSKSKHVHAYLGFENSSPEELIQKAWKDVLQYNSIKVVREKVVEVESVYDDNNNSNNHFILSTNSGELIVKAKYLVISTGVQGSKPNVRNFEMFEGNSAWHCPHCDGFQSTNKKLAIITNAVISNILTFGFIFLASLTNSNPFIVGIRISDIIRE
jgi:hypothetical protein